MVEAAPKGRHPVQFRFVVGIAVGVGAMILACRGVDWEALTRTFHAVRLGWLVCALASVLGAMALVTTRWRLLFYPQHQERSWLNLFRGMLMGQVINLVMPGRMGDFARAYVIGANDPVGKAQTLGTIVVEKVIDVVIFGIGVLILGAVVDLPSWAKGIGNSLVWLGGAVTLMMLIFAFNSDLCLVFVSNVRWLPERLRQFVVRHGTKAADGFRALRSSRAMATIWLLSCIIFVLSIATNYLIFRALDLQLNLSAALFLLVALQAGNAPPTIPGKLGVFHYLCVLVLSFYGVERTTALAYSLLLYFVTVLWKILAAGLLLILRPKDRSPSTN